MNRTVYLLQENKESVEEIKKYLSVNFDVIGESTSGERAIVDISVLRPDLLVTELICSGQDGFAVLQAIKDKGLKVKPVVVTSITLEDAVKRATSLGALYYMVKPIEGSVIAERLAEIAEDGALYKKREQASLDERISKIFISVGIPPHIKGYAYLREGVKMAVRAPEVINSITTKLYPGIGEKYATTPSKVERAIELALAVI